MKKLICINTLEDIKGLVQGELTLDDCPNVRNCKRTQLIDKALCCYYCKMCKVFSKCLKKEEMQECIDRFGELPTKEKVIAELL